MYAIIEDSGTQIRVCPGDVVDVDLRDLGRRKKSVVFDRVMLVSPGEGDAMIGTPYVEGASVTAELLDEIKDRKVTVFKFKRRKGYRRKHGHRQRYLRVRIKDIKV